MNGVGFVEEKVLDLSNIRTTEEFHKYLQKELEFPDFYGANWNAFWDAITGLVELPQTLIIIGWENIVAVLPEDAATFIDLLNKLNSEYPMLACVVKNI